LCASLELLVDFAAEKKECLLVQKNPITVLTHASRMLCPQCPSGRGLLSFWRRLFLLHFHAFNLQGLFITQYRGDCSYTKRKEGDVSGHGNTDSSRHPQTRWAGKSACTTRFARATHLLTCGLRQRRHSCALRFIILSLVRHLAYLGLNLLDGGLCIVQLGLDAIFPSHQGIMLCFRGRTKGGLQEPGEGTEGRREAAVRNRRGTRAPALSFHLLQARHWLVRLLVETDEGWLREAGKQTKKLKVSTRRISEAESLSFSISP